MRPLFFRIAATFLVFAVFRAEARAQAVVTQAVGQVERGAHGRALEAVGQGDALKEDQLLKTGQKSRAELKFTDESVARLGSMSMFSFRPEQKAFQLQEGSLLMVFPKGKGGARVAGPAISAGILGTTIYLEVSSKQTVYACLEGKCRVGAHVLNPGERLILRGAGASYGSSKEAFRIARFLQQNELAKAFGPLPSLKLIEAEAAAQK